MQSSTSSHIDKSSELQLSLADEPVVLLAQRALYWPRERTLFVADVHLGKSATFRAAGIPVPAGDTAADLARLSRLIQATGAERLVVLGDLLHSRSGRVASLDLAYCTWRRAHSNLAVMLLRGNHDARAGDPPVHWGIDVVSTPHFQGPFCLHHEPPEAALGGDALSGYVLCGHVHPGVMIEARGSDAARLPCFVIGKSRAIIPAFGRFTGLFLVTAQVGERIVAVADSRLFALPVRVAP